MHRKAVTFMLYIFVSYLLCPMTVQSSKLEKTNSSVLNEIPQNMKLSNNENSTTANEVRRNESEIKFTVNPDDGITSVQVEKKIRKPVKFSMRQGLIVNQIVATYALSELKPGRCFNHTEEFKAGLRALEPWALKMFDSSSKLQSGILNGNLMEYGSFQQCLNIYENTNSGPIQGKFCTFVVIPDAKLVKIILSYKNISEKRYENLRTNVLEVIKLRWSVCVPESCEIREIFNHFNKSITDVTEGLNLSITLTEENCISSNDRPTISNIQILLMSILVIIVITVIVASVFDYCNVTSDSPNWFVDVFSAYSNGKRVFAKGLGDSELDCLHGLRFLSVCYVVCGHRYMEIMEFPLVNSLDLTDWIQSYFSKIIIGGTISVDTFFVLSGTLLSYNFFNNISKHEKINFLYFYLLRYIRIAVPLAAAIIIIASVVQFLGSGPLWKETYVNLQMPCQKFWWSSLLFIQNYTNDGYLVAGIIVIFFQITYCFPFKCIVQTWYLTDDMLLFYCSPIILYPLWKRPKMGYLNLIFLYLLSISVSFYFAWINKYSGSMPTTANLLETKYFRKFYIQAHTRAPTYIIGVGFGYVIFRTKGKKVNFNVAVKAIGWILTIVLMMCPIIGEHVFLDENHVYNRFESSLFLSCSRSAWSIGIVWIVWCCVNGYGGIVNDILTLHIFRVLGRIGFGIFIWHILFQFLKGGSAKTPEYFSNFITIYAFCADILLMILLGFGFSLCFEYPVMRLQSALLKHHERNTKVVPDGIRVKIKSLV